jgi:hypothetical protein
MPRPVAHRSGPIAVGVRKPAPVGLRDRLAQQGRMERYRAKVGASTEADRARERQIAALRSGDPVTVEIWRVFARDEILASGLTGREMVSLDEHDRLTVGTFNAEMRVRDQETKR